MALLLILFAIAGIVALSEYLMSRNSKWDVLTGKFGNSATPPNGWHACKFLRMEIQEGNVLKVTTYSHGYGKSSSDIITAKLFPKAFASAGPAGLYLKRQPWNFLHRPLLIPWGRVTSAQILSATDFGKQSAGRQIPVPGLKLPNLPGPIAGFINTLVGDVVEVRLADPIMRLQIPVAAVGDVTSYLKPKPTAPVKQPPPLVGAV